MRGFFAALVATTALAIDAARAQNFNVDVGAPSSTPPSAFGGAAQQPGTWNSVGFVPTTPAPLLGLTGAPTTATIRCNGGLAITSTNALPPAAQFNQGLVALVADLTSPGTLPYGEWTFDGLQAGEYEVTTYAYASDDGLSSSSFVEVLGSPDPGVWVNITTGWTSGVLELGITHAVHRVVVQSSAPLVVRVGIGADASVNGFQLRLVSAGEPFCAGDGVDPSVTTACPCANTGAAGHGCASSANAAGARLDASGATNPDALVLLGSGMPATSTCVFVQCDARGDQVLGDGVGCLSGSIVRLATKSNGGGASSFPQAGDPSVSTRGQVVPGSGAVRHYQLVYRNAASFCTPSTFNTSNARTIVW